MKNRKGREGKRGGDGWTELRRTIDRIFRPRHAKYLELMFEPSPPPSLVLRFHSWRPLACLGDKGSWRPVLLSQPSFQLPGNSRRRPFNFTSLVHAASNVVFPPVFSPARTMLNDKFSNIRLKPTVFPPPPWNFTVLLFLPRDSTQVSLLFSQHSGGLVCTFFGWFGVVVLTGTGIEVNCGRE